jgi:hypothetical protein
LWALPATFFGFSCDLGVFLFGFETLLCFRLLATNPYFGLPALRFESLSYLSIIALALALLTRKLSISFLFQVVKNNGKWYESNLSCPTGLRKLVVVRVTANFFAFGRSYTALQ